MANKLDTDTKVEVIIDDENKLYKCLKCNEISKRRYNAERHYKRFHENTFPKKICCGTIFPTKGDFYVHKEIAHNEKRKYQERFKKHFQISKIDEFKDSENISNVNENKSILKNMENFNQVSRRTKMKNMSKIIKSNSSTLHNEDDKENTIKIYNITDLSTEGLKRGLLSINF